MLAMVLHVVAFFITVVGVLGAIWVFSSVEEDYRVSYILLTLAIVLSVSVYTLIDILIEYYGVYLLGYGHFIQDIAFLLGAIFFVGSVVHLYLRTFPKRREVARRERFLTNILTQDVRNKISTSTGYLELIDPDGMGEDEVEFLEKAIDNNFRVSEILELADSIRRLDDHEIGVIDIGKVLEGSVKDVEDFSEENSVEIRSDISQLGSVNVQGSYALKEVFPAILKSIIRRSGTEKIILSADETEKEVIVGIEDDGRSLPSDLKENVSEGSYSGNTSDYGGPIYLLGSKMIQKFGGSLVVEDSDLGGSKIRIELKKT